MGTIRIAWLIALFLTTAVFLAATPAWAQATDLTLQAQAPATTDKLPDWMAYQDPYAAAGSDTRAAHMANADVALWVQSTATEALTVPAASYEQKLAAQRPRFSDKGWGEYGQFLQDSRVLDVARGGRDVLTIADGEARVINSGEAAGHYLWTVSLPVLQSVAGSGSQKQTLAIDVIRVKAAASLEEPVDNGLRIDSVRSGALAP